MNSFVVHSADETASLKGPIFNPALYIQRYHTVANEIKKFSSECIIKSIIDFGCAECSFLKYIKNIPGVEDIACVDADGSILDRNKHRAAPLTTEYLDRRSDPLIISIFEGSIDKVDERLKSYDAVTCIELIEHLNQDVLTKFPEVLFGFIQPKIAIFTTPNREFNVLFPTLKSLRHWDHKFEWTRNEFQQWCHSIVRHYPMYSFIMDGIGDGPPGSEELGCCSQMAIFRLHPNYTPDFCESRARFNTIGTPYSLIVKYEYPFEKSQPKSVLLEAEYYIRYLAYYIDEYPVLVPLKKLLTFSKVTELCNCEEQLKSTLVKAGWNIVEKNEECFIEYKNESSSDNDDNDFVDDFEYSLKVSEREPSPPASTPKEEYWAD